MNPAVVFEPGLYYELRSNVLLFSGQDVENWSLKSDFKLRRKEIVLCTGFVTRVGGQGRGKYVKFLVRSDDAEWTLYHRVSRLNVGSGQWIEVNPMIVLALADRLPTL